MSKRERERERERCRACLDLGLSGRVREKEKGREDRMVSIGVLEIWKWPLELGRGILIGTLVKGGLVLKVRVKSVRKNTRW